MPSGTPQEVVDEIMSYIEKLMDITKTQGETIKRLNERVKDLEEQMSLKQDNQYKIYQAKMLELEKHIKGELKCSPTN